jgi:hypothetical protein
MYKFPQNYCNYYSLFLFNSFHTNINHHQSLSLSHIPYPGKSIKPIGNGKSSLSLRGHIHSSSSSHQALQKYAPKTFGQTQNIVFRAQEPIPYAHTKHAKTYKSYLVIVICLGPEDGFEKGE